MKNQTQSKAGKLPVAAQRRIQIDERARRMLAREFADRVIDDGGAVSIPAVVSLPGAAWLIIARIAARDRVTIDEALGRVAAQGVDQVVAADRSAVAAEIAR